MGAAQSQLTVYRSTASAPGQRIIAVFNGANYGGGVRLREAEENRHNDVRNKEAGVKRYQPSAMSSDTQEMFSTFPARVPV